MNPHLAVWLAGPSARGHFEADAQTPEDRERWAKLTHPERQAEWEVSRALLAHVRAAYSASHEAARTEPALASPLSLSHSHGHAAVAASHTARGLGVDLEGVRRRDFLRLARFAYSAAELAQLQALPAPARAERFYVLWTLKEAFAKALSLPLLQSASQCTFVQVNDAWRASVPAPGAWIARTFRPSDLFVLSVVALLPETTRGSFSISTGEWPEAAPPWPLLATLSSA